MKGAQLLLSSLKNQGANNIFGIVGREGSSIRFNEVDGIKFYLTRHEMTAGIAAEVYARSTGRAQVCFSTLGPGATNLATAISSACLDRSPLVAISAQAESFDLHYNNTQQCIDQRRMMEPLCKYSAEPVNVEDIPKVVQKAFSAAYSEVPGPSYLSIPINLFRQNIDDRIARQLLDEFSHTDIKTPSDISAEAVSEVYELLSQAKCPIAILGNYIIRAKAGESLRRFVEKFEIPAVNTYTAKGILPASHPNNVGTISCYLDGLLTYDCLDEIFDQTDVVLLLGYDYVEDVRPDMWMGGKEKKVIRVSSFPNPIEGFHTDLDVVGNIDTLLSRLNTDYASFGHSKLNIDRFRERKTEFMSQKSRNSDRMIPQEVISSLNKYMNEDSILISDVGLHRVHTTLFGDVKGYNSFFASCGCATFGFALPAAMGAQIANPDKNVFAVVGDGGFHSGSHDLETLARYNLPVVFLLMKDSNMGLIKLYENLDDGEPNLDTVQFGGVDFVKLAEANNCRGVSVSKVSDLENEIAKALAARKPTVIEIPIDYDYQFRGNHHKKSLGDFIDAK